MKNVYTAYIVNDEDTYFLGVFDNEKKAKDKINKYMEEQMDMFGTFEENCDDISSPYAGPDKNYKHVVYWFDNKDFACEVHLIKTKIE